MSSFHNIPTSYTNFFTDTTVDLFPANCDTGISSNLQTCALKNVTPPPELPALPDGSLLTNSNSSESIHSPPLRCSTQVRELSLKVRNYKCFSTTLSLYEPQIYSKANSNLVWWQAIAKEL